MLNRLRRWFFRRIEGAPITPLSVLSHGPYTTSDLEAMKGGFSRLRGHNDFGPRPFDHDAVQLQADESADPVRRAAARTAVAASAKTGRPVDPRVQLAADEEELQAVIDRHIERWAGVLEALRPNDGPVPPVTYTDEGWRRRTADYDPDYDYHLGSDYR